MTISTKKKPATKKPATKATKAKPALERTPRLLADKIEPVLLGQRRKRFAVNMVCESKEEAEALVALLKKRGWKATVEPSINLTTGKPHIGAVVTGRQARKATA